MKKTALVFVVFFNVVCVSRLSIIKVVFFSIFKYQKQYAKWVDTFNRNYNHPTIGIFLSFNERYQLKAANFSTTTKQSENAADNRQPLK